MKRYVIALGLALFSAMHAQAADFCFGGVGQQCGGITMESVQFAACVPNVFAPPLAVCAVSGGSMTHDPCCADHPRGKMCGTSPEQPAVCKIEWDRAVSRFFWGYQWSRVVDTSKSNTSGNVVFGDYCAKSGRGVHKNDKGFCCSGDAKNAGFFERLTRPSLKICR
jgi:hypothetical protein